MKKYKICNFSHESKLLKISKEEIVEQFEQHDGFDLSVEEALSSACDVIEFDYPQFDNFAPLLRTIGYQTHQMGIANCLIRAKDTFRPLDLNSLALSDILTDYKKHVDTSLSVMLIGEIDFVLALVIKLAQCGFSDMVIAFLKVTDAEQSRFAEKVNRIAFGLNLKFVSLDDLTTLEESSSLFICNFKKELNPSAYELLTYFNFLSPGALLLDWNSLTDDSLVEEARRAEIFAIGELEILEYRYKSLAEILKISP